MPYRFFVSYTRGNYDGCYMLRFLSELNNVLREKVGLPLVDDFPTKKDDDIVFFDQKDVERGDEWDPAISAALQLTRVMVCLYSPAYFNSDYCGKEWQVYKLRRDRYVSTEKHKGHSNVLVPSVIKPVIWIPMRGSYPKSVAGTQYKDGNPDAVHNKWGLQYMLKQGDSLKTQFNDYILDLANEMLDTYDKIDLPRLEPIPALKEVANSFRAGEAEPGQPGTEQLEGAGPQSVVFVIVAARPGEIATTGRIGTEAYQSRGGGDWKPYFPKNAKRIYALAAHEATGDDLDFNPEEKPFTADLSLIVREAETQRNIVIIIVDAWTALLPEYKRGLQEFDRQNYINCAVLVPWNRNDKESMNQSEVLTKALDEAIPWRSKNYKNTIYYRDDIQTEEDLRNRIRETLTRLRSEVLSKADVQRPLPGAGTLPTFKV